MRSFAEVEEYLQRHRPDAKAVDWSFRLEDMQRLMAGLGNPQELTKVIHVAGTSGKTSTAYYIAKMLQLSGASVGLTVSPHVDSINERTQINMEPLAEAEFLKLFNKFVALSAVKEMAASYFGLLAAFSYWVFAKKHLDYAVVEVGMGGRLDATNVVNDPSKVAVITDIGLDHTEFLGKDIASITGEKAGIIQPGNEVFTAEQATEVMDVLRKVCDRQKAGLHILPAGEVERASQLLPPFQKRNWALAADVFRFVGRRDNLDFFWDEVASESSALVVPARMEEFRIGSKIVITDGSHNGQKLEALVKGLQQKYPRKSLIALVSFAEGKDSALNEGLGALARITNKLIITKFEGGQDLQRQALEPKLVAEAAGRRGITQSRIIDEPEKAFEELLKQPEDILLITGSFFLLNHVRPAIKALQ